ncbi:MAG TPA: hypothetical protein DEA90_10415 [Opitutae bacterium]|nr:hypothetical protein [Opitutae bacterium]
MQQRPQLQAAERAGAESLFHDRLGERLQLDTPGQRKAAPLRPYGFQFRQGTEDRHEIHADEEVVMFVQILRHQFVLQIRFDGEQLVGLQLDLG